MTTLEQDHAEWQTRRLAALTAADGWLSLIGLEWLDDGEYAVGSAEDCAIRLEAAAPRAGVLRMAGGGAVWTPTAGPVLAMENDTQGAPTVVVLDRYRFHLIDRDGRLALRIKDTEAQTRRAFRGIDHFPFDPAWIAHGRWDGEVARFELQGQAWMLRPQRPDARPLSVRHTRAGRAAGAGLQPGHQSALRVHAFCHLPTADAGKPPRTGRHRGRTLRRPLTRLAATQGNRMNIDQRAPHPRPLSP